jgi:hypothetical protein
VGLAAAISTGIVLVYAPTSDLPAFLRGAELVARGESPYNPAAPLHNYLYAPWLAYALIPATWLPFSLVAVIWHGLLAGALIAGLLPLLRSLTLEGTLAAVLLGAFGFHAVWAGHYQPLLICLLVYALPTRWGPVAIGIAASLKVTPLVLALRYASRAEWDKVGISVMVAGVLWAPALLFDVAGYGTVVGKTLSLFGHAPVAWAILAVGATAVAWWAGPTRYGWLAAAAAWLAILPRMLLYDIAALAIGATPDGRSAATKTRRRSIAVGEQQHRYPVPMGLAPARVVGSAGDEGGRRRQEDRIGAVRVEQ